MPIIKYNTRTLHFAHIPKCAGSSVESYIKKINGAELAFVDISFVGNPAKKPWNISSPQHIDGASFARLFPRSFFDSFFAVVRDPLSRLKSAYKFQRIVEKKIASSQPLDLFIKKQLQTNYANVGWMDNHFLPQSRLLYPNTGYQIFKLERDGLGPVKKYIDNQLFGNAIDLKMPFENAAKKIDSFDQSDLELSLESIEILNEIYKDDFMRFKYPKIVAG